MTRNLVVPSLLLTLVVGLGSLAAPTAAHAQVSEPHEGLSFLDTGPFRIREQFLLTQPFLAFDPVSAEVLEAGHWQVDLVQSATNTWAQSKAVERFLEDRDRRQPLTLEELRSIEPETPGTGLYYADGELYRTSLSIRRGLGRGWQVTVTVPLLNFQGGFGDEIIEEWHDTFGFEQQGRLGVPKDAYTVYVRDPEGNEVFRSERAGTGLGDVVVGIKKRLPSLGEQDQWNLAVEGVANLPSGEDEDFYGSGSADFGGQLLATRYFARSCVHLGLGAIYNGDSEIYPLDSQVLPSGFVGYERALGRSWSAVAQLTVSQSPLEDLEIERLDDTAYLVDLGVKKGLTRNTVLFVAITENIVNLGSTEDVGGHIGITYTR